MADVRAHVVGPDDISGLSTEFPVPLTEPRFLAQGDSWFSIGAIPPFLTSNILLQLALSKATLVVNCAVPGQFLSHMIDTTCDAKFLRLLTGDLSFKWNAILLSGGGNDLIDALQAPPTNPVEHRLLLPREEWGTGVSADRYLSEPGWLAFEDYMGKVLDQFLGARDSGQNRSVPVYFHTYDIPTPRDALVGPGIGPWLCKALRAYEIPETDWKDLTHVLFLRLQALLTQLAKDRTARAVNIVDTVGTLTTAALDTTGPDGDWANEIHPTHGGYAKLAQAWRTSLDPLVG